MIGWYVRPKEGLLFTYVVCQIVAGFFVQNGRPRIIILSKVDIFQISSFYMPLNKNVVYLLSPNVQSIIKLFPSL